MEGPGAATKNSAPEPEPRAGARQNGTAPEPHAVQYVGTGMCLQRHGGVWVYVRNLCQYTGQILHPYI